MSVYESSITNPKKQLEFYKVLSEQLQQENKQLKEELELKSGMNIAVQNLKLIDENKQLKEVIEEVREYIKECSSREISLDILEILDKVKVG